MNKQYILYLLTLFFFNSCTNKKNDCSEHLGFFRGNEYSTKGCLVDSLENGEWSIYRDDDEVIEKGSFKDGIRFGNWYYPENRADSIINWKRYEKKELDLIFNIPSALEVVDDSLHYIKFSNTDTTKLFNLVLAVHDMNNLNYKVDEYEKQGVIEIDENGWTYSRERTRILFGNQILYFNKYKINIDTSSSFRVLNAYTVTANNQLFEISARYNELTEISAKAIFFSVLTNCFYKEKRLINPFRKIHSITQIEK